MTSLDVTACPKDALFALMARYKKDTFERKVDLGVGAYRTDAGQPWVLPVVRKVDQALSQDPSVNHEYLPIAGDSDFVRAAGKLVLGSSIDLDQVASVQTLSGTGANHMGSRLLQRFPAFGSKSKTIWVSNPTWVNHNCIFEFNGLQVKTYPYWDSETRSLNFDGMMKSLTTEAERGDAVLLHACAHNPTGLDPTRDQWKQIADVCKKRQLFVVFDSAYQGFASGDLDADAWSLRYFVEQKIDLIICQSLAKNMGLYGERAGAIHVVLPGASPEQLAAVKSQLELQTRAEFSNCPAYGARIATRVLTDPALFEQWKGEVRSMSERIHKMRLELRSALEKLDTPGTWDHITSQIGMFSFTGLNKEQVARMVDEFHVYMSANGRISMAGLNNSNVQYVAECINRVVRGN